MVNDPRQVLQRLCAERGEDFAGLSRMLGRNPAYIQQYVRRGVPRRLGEDERRKLARYFAVPETLLGASPEDETAANGLLSVKRHPVAASAGPGAIVTEELGKPYFAFDQRWLSLEIHCFVLVISAKLQASINKSRPTMFFASWAKAFSRSGWETTRPRSKPPKKSFGCSAAPPATNLPNCRLKEGSGTWLSLLWRTRWRCPTRA